MMRFASLSSAMPTGLTPIAARWSTNENSSATTRCGVPVIVTEPSVPLTVRDFARAGPQVGSNLAADLAGALTAAPVSTRVHSPRSSRTAPIRFFTTAPSVGSAGTSRGRLPGLSRQGAQMRTLRQVALAALELEDLRLELLQERLAAPQPVAGLRLVRRAEPVPLLHPLVPGADLLVLHPDLFRLFVRVVLAEVLELDLLDEVDLAVLDDLGVMLGRLVDEQLHELRLLGLRQLDERQQVVAAAVALVDPLQHRVELGPGHLGVGEDADRVLQVDRASLLQRPPHGDASRCRLGRHPVDDLEELARGHVSCETIASSFGWPRPRR